MGFPGPGVVGRHGRMGFPGPGVVGRHGRTGFPGPEERDDDAHQGCGPGQQNDCRCGDEPNRPQLGGHLKTALRGFALYRRNEPKRPRFELQGQRPRVRRACCRRRRVGASLGRRDFCLRQWRRRRYRQARNHDSGAAFASAAPAGAFSGAESLRSTTRTGEANHGSPWVEQQHNHRLHEEARGLEKGNVSLTGHNLMSIKIYQFLNRAAQQRRAARAHSPLQVGRGHHRPPLASGWTIDSRWTEPRTRCACLRPGLR